MKVDSLEELVAAFNEWRGKKRYQREPTPKDLVTRARRAASVHGVGRVVRAVGISSRHLQEGSEGERRGRGVSAPSLPSYSRLELVAPAGTARPIAEVEMPNGIKVRLFSQTEEILSLLSSVCVAGSER